MTACVQTEPRCEAPRGGPGLPACGRQNASCLPGFVSVDFDFAKVTTVAPFRLQRYLSVLHQSPAIKTTPNQRQTASRSDASVSRLPTFGDRCSAHQTRGEGCPALLFLLRPSPPFSPFARSSLPDDDESRRPSDTLPSADTVGGARASRAARDVHLSRRSSRGSRLSANQRATLTPLCSRDGR